MINVPVLNEIGEMASTPDMPWHECGSNLEVPVTMDDAIRAGGLDWRIELVDICTDEEPSSPIASSQALVRVDREPSHVGRALGVADRGFVPLQNHDAFGLMDSVYGQGRAVYHSAGYLGYGHRIWAIAELPEVVEIVPGDPVQGCVLMTHTHGARITYSIQMAIARKQSRTLLADPWENFQFNGTYWEYSRAFDRVPREYAPRYVKESLDNMRYLVKKLNQLAVTPCEDIQFEQVLADVFPERRWMTAMEKSPAVQRARKQIQDARDSIRRIRAETQTAKGNSDKTTWWDALNAVLEFIDHHCEVKGSRLAYALLGDGMELKKRAFRAIGKVVPDV